MRLNYSIIDTFILLFKTIIKAGFIIFSFSLNLRKTTPVYSRENCLLSVIMKPEEAVRIIISNMPEQYRLKELLQANLAEVMDMWLTEYDEKETMQMFKEEGRTEGRAEGKIEGDHDARISICLNLLKEGMDPPVISRLTGIREEEVRKLSV